MSKLSKYPCVRLPAPSEITHPHQHLRVSTTGRGGAQRPQAPRTNVLLDYALQYLNRNTTALLSAGTVFSLAQIRRLPEVKVWAWCSSSNTFLFKN